MVVRGWAKSATVDWNRVVALHGIRAPIKNLRELLWEETLADGNTEERFARWAKGDGRDIRFEADTRIAAEMKQGFVPNYNYLSFDCITAEAELWEEKFPKTAGFIYMGLSESLGIHINMIDDDCDFWPLFVECVKGIGRCVQRQGLGDRDRRRYIEYLAGWSTVAFDGFMEYYETELARLCIDARDLAVWQEQLDYALTLDDIENRDCYWAIDKKGIEAARKRVLKRIKTIKVQ